MKMQSTKEQAEWKVIKHGATLPTQYRIGEPWEVSITEEKGLFDLFMLARSAGVPLFLKDLTLEKVNEFLKKLGYPAIEYAR